MQQWTTMQLHNKMNTISRKNSKLLSQTKVNIKKLCIWNFETSWEMRYDRKYRNNE